MRALRPPRRFGKLALTLLTTCLFLAVSSIPQFTAPAYAGNEPASPLPVAEDPLGQQPEQQTPEISIDVDVRDGHLTVRVVDIWGPGRTPFVVRSYTNTLPSTTSSSGTSNPDQTRGVWQFNHLSDIVPGTDTDPGGIREPDGNRAVYKWCPGPGSVGCTRWNGNYSEMWLTHTKDIGTYSTMETHYTCVPGDPEGLLRPPAPRAPRPAAPAAVRPHTVRVRPQNTTLTLDCTWDGYWTRFLPKGRTQRYTQNPAPGEGGAPSGTSGLIVEDKDANGNTTTFTYTTFSDQVQKYLATVVDPVGRVTTYSYEHSHQVCAQYDDQGTCVLWKWHYRVRQVTDPWGRSATYTYGANGRLTAVLNAAGFTTGYAYDQYGRLNAVTNARGHATGITWTTLWNKGRVTRVTAPGGAQTNYAYTFAGGQLTRTVVTDALGHATTHEFYAGTDEKQFGNVIRTTDALNNVTQYAYDDRHNVTQVTDAKQNRTTYQYNTRNKVTQVIRAVGTLNLTTTATWDDKDNQLTLEPIPKPLGRRYAERDH
jgi:YD repeat-containing protein